MAWYGRYTPKQRFYRGRNWVNRNFMASGRRYGRKGMGLNLSVEFLAGLAVGAATDIDNKIPANVKVFAACAPVRGMGKVKGFAQGLLVGDMLSGFVPRIGNGNGNRSFGNEL